MSLGTYSVKCMNGKRHVLLVRHSQKQRRLCTENSKLNILFVAHCQSTKMLFIIPVTPSKMLLFIIPVTPRCCCLLYLWLQDAVVYYTCDPKMLLFIMPVTPRCCCLLYMWHQDALVYYTHGGRWSNRTYRVPALSCLLSTFVVFWSLRCRVVEYTPAKFSPERM